MSEGLKECRYLYNGDFCQLIKTEIMLDGGTMTNSCHNEKNNNCYYKQLLSAQKEIEELKELNKKVNCIGNAMTCPEKSKLKAERDRYKEALKVQLNKHSIVDRLFKETPLSSETLFGGIGGCLSGMKYDIKQALEV